MYRCRSLPCPGGDEAHQPPPESEYIPFAVIERNIFFGYPKFNDGLYILVMWHEYVLCSKYGEVPTENTYTYFSVYRCCVKNNKSFSAAPTLFGNKSNRINLDKRLPNNKIPL